MRPGASVRSISGACVQDGHRLGPKKTVLCDAIVAESARRTPIPAERPLRSIARRPLHVSRRPRLNDSGYAHRSSTAPTRTDAGNSAKSSTRLARRRPLIRRTRSRSFAPLAATPRTRDPNPACSIAAMTPRDGIRTGSPKCDAVARARPSIRPACLTRRAHSPARQAPREHGERGSGSRSCSAGCIAEPCGGTLVVSGHA